MNWKILASIAAGLLAGPIAAQATSIVGDWSGSGIAVVIGPTGNGAVELADLVILSSTPGGALFDLLGTIDVTCVGFRPSSCGTGGVVDISGTLSSSGMLDFGTAGNPDLFAGTYSGGDTITGVATSLDGDVYDWTFNQETPEPATVALFGLGLAGIGFMRRRWAS